MSLFKNYFCDDVRTCSVHERRAARKIHQKKKRVWSSSRKSEVILAIRMPIDCFPKQDCSSLVLYYNSNTVWETPPAHNCSCCGQIVVAERGAGLYIVFLSSVMATQSVDCVAWEWQRDDGGFSPYAPETSSLLEAASTSATPSLPVGPQHVVHFSRMVQKRRSSGRPGSEERTGGCIDKGNLGCIDVETFFV